MCSCSRCISPVKNIIDEYYLINSDSIKRNAWQIIVNLKFVTQRLITSVQRGGTVASKECPQAPSLSFSSKTKLDFSLCPTSHLGALSQAGKVDSTSNRYYRALMNSKVQFIAIQMAKNPLSLRTSFMCTPWLQQSLRHLLFPIGLPLKNLITALHSPK